MNYSDFDTTTDTEAAPWTATPASQPSQMVPAPRGGQMVPSNTNVASASDMVVLGSLIQSLQQTQQRQMYLLRDLDERLGHLENAARPNTPAQVPSFERTTWWAIWGLLMLILGGALAVLIVLIMMRVTFR